MKAVKDLILLAVKSLTEEQLNEIAKAAQIRAENLRKAREVQVVIKDGEILENIGGRAYLMKKSCVGGMSGRKVADVYENVVAVKEVSPGFFIRLFDREQLRRGLQISLADALRDWVSGRTMDFSLTQAAMEGLKLDAAKLTRDLQTRVAIALRQLGCTRERRNGMYLYKPPCAL